MSYKKGIYFTSDWHIGHENILKYCPRPYRDLQEMHEILILNFNNVVKGGDVTYFLGDMGMCHDKVLKSVIDELNGTKILILGNHDKKAAAMYQMGFDAVLYNATIYIGNDRISLSHCPLFGVFREDTSQMKGAVPGENWYGESKKTRFTVKDEGQFHLHGHIHSPNKGQSKKILGRQFDVGIDANNYNPVSISEIESWIALYKKGKSTP